MIEHEIAARYNKGVEAREMNSQYTMKAIAKRFNMDPTTFSRVMSGEYGHTKYMTGRQLDQCRRDINKGRQLSAIAAANGIFALKKSYKLSVETIKRIVAEYGQSQTMQEKFLTMRLTKNPGPCHFYY